MDDRQLHPHKSGILDDLMPTGETLGWAAEAGDPFSVLRTYGSARPFHPLPTAQVEPVDVLAQLSQEAEAVLRNPELASAHQHLAPPRRGATLVTDTAETVSDPLLTKTDDSLLDMLAGKTRIDDLIGTDETLDAYQVLVMPPAPDVLHLFAGDIAISGLRGITAALTRREHHLVSMDSAYLPAPAHPLDSEPYED